MHSATSVSLVKSLLQEHGFAAQRRLGQSFLVDANVRDRIVAAAQIVQGDCALEIGPGLGALTEALCKVASRTVAVEVDRGLAGLLRKRLVDERLTIVEADFLALDLEALCGDTSRWKVVANVPYAITTPIVIRLLDAKFPEAVLMVQSEVATRLAAVAGDRRRGAISVFTQNIATVETVLRVPPTCFYPMPRVTSTVIRLTRRQQALALAPADAFRDVVRAIFGYRRKTLVKALQEGLGVSRQAALTMAHENGMDPALRGETLDIQAFDTLAQTLCRLRQEEGGRP